MIAKLYANHQSGDVNHGFVSSSKNEPSVCDAVKEGVLDLEATKRWAIKFATTAACTVLRVDQVMIFV